jgi:hypothetical protein
MIEDDLKHFQDRFPGTSIPDYPSTYKNIPQAIFKYYTFKYGKDSVLEEIFSIFLFFAEAKMGIYIDIPKRRKDANFCALGGLNLQRQKWK